VAGIKGSGNTQAGLEGLAAEPLPECESHEVQRMRQAGRAGLRTSGGGKGPAAAAASLVLHRGHMPICGVVDALHDHGGRRGIG
jgi:hypothetical protein